MELEYHDLTVVIKIPKYSQYERESTGQDYHIFVKNGDKVSAYTGVKPARLATVLEVLIFNPAQEVKSLPL